MRKTPALAIAALLAACSPERDPGQSPTGQPDAGRRAPSPNDAAEPGLPPAADSQAPPQPQPLFGEATARAEWAKADNRADCAPLALKSVGGVVGATPRRALFSGGWGVAFDTPGRRSAFGFAGPGLLPADRADFAVQLDVLARQWPHVRRWDAAENLPGGSAAGYGVIGAEPYPADNPAGQRLHSLAYLRIPGQACQYNVWSRISRAHLEAILGALRVIGSPAR